MISITICDDEPGTCSDIENIILNYTHSHAIETEIEIFYIFLRNILHARPVLTA